MNKQDLIDLLLRLHDYMDQRSDADGDSEGYHANEEMKLQIEIGDALYALGETSFGDTARASVDPDYKPNTMLQEQISNMKRLFKKK